MIPYTRANPESVLRAAVDIDGGLRWPTDMKESILGLIEIPGGDRRIVCSKRLAIEIQMRNGMDRETALDYLELNTFCVAGDNMPLWLDDEEP